MFQLLRRVVPTSHLLFGSDYSCFPVAHSVKQLSDLELGEETAAAAAGGNAMALFPRSCWLPSRPAAPARLILARLLSS